MPVFVPEKFSIFYKTLHFISIKAYKIYIDATHFQILVLILEKNYLRNDILIPCIIFAHAQVYKSCVLLACMRPGSCNVY